MSTTNLRKRPLLAARNLKRQSIKNYSPHDNSKNAEMEHEDSSDEDGSFNGFTSSNDEFERSGSRTYEQPSKRIKLNWSEQENEGIPPEYLVIHRVGCSLGKNHSHHESHSDFLDVPRLLARDNKASPLRGSNAISNVEDYLEDSEQISMVVYRIYDCEKYHEQISGKFEYLQLSANGLHVVSHLRPYLYVLSADGPDATPESESITILSKELQHGLEVLQQVDPEIGVGTSSLIAPYLPLYHSRHSMEKCVFDLLNESERQHVNVLLEYVEEALGHDFTEADVLFEQGLVTEKHFSKLFKAGEPVVTTQNGQPMAYVPKSLPTGDNKTLTLICDSWTFDRRFKRNFSNLSVTWPKTATTPIRITDLDVYPLRYDDTDLERRLKERGSTLWKCRKSRYVSYKASSASLAMQTVTPRYMIDMNTYWHMHPEEAPTSQQDDLGTEAMEMDDPPDETFLLLQQATIPGFGFHDNDKKWITLNIEDITDINWSTHAFDRLVLHPNKKELIKALISVHVETAASTDIIEGKGNGLIILLHGGPGTGKTLTAESIAELTEKPLYRVTCGDIGTNPEEVEKYLETVLLVGTIWSCVVLLDEADVFLEERSQADLQRNALVSVFLRVLEYYDGILILTSNRVGTFDEAFKSRVQLALHYPDLDEMGRLKIWKSFIKSLEGKNVEFDELSLKVGVLAKSRLNGRQIRNTVKTAMQLAYFRKQPLDYSHFERVIEVAEDFEKYVDETHGHTDRDWAKEEGLRA